MWYVKCGMKCRFEEWHNGESSRFVMFRKIILLTVVFSMYLMAADVLTLEDCLRIARENNAALKSAKVNRQMAEETEGSAFPIASISIFRLDSSRLASRALYSVSIVVFS